ncbi:MAG: helix-hairpin-helix domain-containing protein [Hahellaceae bacterium]|nr:helix-hairpin-helix domain-containing protein [Hahellaceae bacterium]
MYATHISSPANQTSELTLGGTCGYTIEGKRIHLSVSEILNRRDLDNLSGTLSLEVWALKQAYTGGNFIGVAMAGTQVGQLGGQHLFANLNYDLPLHAPGEGSWVVCLMLREWTDAGYLTRDFMNFAVPFVVAAEANASVKDNVIRGKFEEKAPATAVAAPVAAAPVEGVAVTVEIEAPKPAKTAKVAKSDAKVKDKASASDGKISINQADVSEIASIKGVSLKLAENIILSRPFQAVEDLLNVKGVGAKLLQKIRDFVTL